jgi:hypothetical protein
VIKISVKAWIIGLFISRLLKRSNNKQKPTLLRSNLFSNKRTNLRIETSLLEAQKTVSFIAPTHNLSQSAW